MPIEKGKNKQGYFYRWGKHGKKYYYKKNSKRSEKLAREKATRHTLTRVSLRSVHYVHFFRLFY